MICPVSRRRPGPAYGAPRIHAELATAGLRQGHKRIARMMRR
ncbi:IS3 family transposase [Actinoplanes sp. NPDC020271]